MSGFKIFKIIQISVYRVRISENLVSLHERVPNLSISSINSAEVQLQPATREIRSLGLLLPPGRGLVLGLLIFFLLSFSFSAFASLSSLVLFLLNSTLFAKCFRACHVRNKFEGLRFERLDWQLWWSVLVSDLNTGCDSAIIVWYKSERSVFFGNRIPILFVTLVQNFRWRFVSVSTLATPRSSSIFDWQRFLIGWSLSIPEGAQKKLYSLRSHSRKVNWIWNWYFFKRSFGFTVTPTSKIIL